MKMQATRFCDGRQSITPEQLQTIVHQAYALTDMMSEKEVVAT